KNMFRKLRAAVTATRKEENGKHHLEFQYDPYSYSLNFDDGFGEDYSYPNKTISVYVI
ncbi:hypothetical protein M569_08648, partial [Genlisea aurea]